MIEERIRRVEIVRAKDKHMELDHICIVTDIGEHNMYTPPDTGKQVAEQFFNLSGVPIKYL